MTADPPSADDLVTAGRVLAAEGLVNAFGHVSFRRGETFLITPPVPLGTLTSAQMPVTVPVDCRTLPAGAPGETWLHASIYRARRDVGAVVRAQPPAAAAMAVSGRPLRALHGQGVLAGRHVPVHPDARLARTRDAGDAVAASLGAAPSLLLRGNGAVTTAATPGAAVARMWALEASAVVNLSVLAVPIVPGLSEEEVDHWSAATEDLLTRLWQYLSDHHDHGTPADRNVHGAPIARTVWDRPR